MVVYSLTHNSIHACVLRTKIVDLPITVGIKCPVDDALDIAPVDRDGPRVGKALRRGQRRGRGQRRL